MVKPGIDFIVENDFPKEFVDVMPLSFLSSVVAMDPVSCQIISFIFLW